MFDFLKKKQKRIDPICKMEEVKGSGLDYDGKWFCSEHCKQRYTDTEENT